MLAAAWYRAAQSGVDVALMWLLHLKTLLRSLLLPPADSLLLAVAGIVLLRRRPLLARSLLIVGVGSLWLLSTPWVADGLTALAEGYPAVDISRLAQPWAQAIVILGGGGERAYAPEYQGPAAEPVMLERLAYGAYLAARSGLPVLVTGFQLETTAMQDTLVRSFGVHPRWVDRDSYDTFQNAHNSARLLAAAGITRILLVTHGTHMRRAVREFTAAGIDVLPAPAGVLTERDAGIWRFVPSAGGLSRSAAATYELMGEPVRALLAATHLRRQAAPAVGAVHRLAVSTPAR
jgi:uncharacterized SAM-binding protein YcdF (DUF218 family)